MSATGGAKLTKKVVRLTQRAACVAIGQLLVVPAKSVANKNQRTGTGMTAPDEAGQSEL